MSTWEESGQLIGEYTMHGTTMIMAKLKNHAGKEVVACARKVPGREMHNHNGELYWRTEAVHPDDQVAVTQPFPHTLYQTHKSQTFIAENRPLLRAQQRWQNMSGLEYRFYDNHECEWFVRENFDRRTLDAYLELPIPVMKADLFRLLVVYHYGGIYADADTCWVSQEALSFELMDDKTHFVAIAENDLHMCNWFFMARKHSPLLKLCIEMCIDQIEVGFDDQANVSQHFIHHMTGPGLFTRAFASYFRSRDLPVFTDMRNYTHDQAGVRFLSFDFHHTHLEHMFYGVNQTHGWLGAR